MYQYIVSIWESFIIKNISRQNNVPDETFFILTEIEHVTDFWNSAWNLECILLLQYYAKHLIQNMYFCTTVLIFYIYNNFVNISSWVFLINQKTNIKK